MRRNPGEAQRPTFRRPLGRQSVVDPKGDPTEANNIFDTILKKQVPHFYFAPYGNWSRIGWTEMTGITFHINIAPVSQTFRLTKCQNLGNS